MSSFQLTSTFAPAGSQPEAIANLKKGLAENDQYHTLLGVTGPGNILIVPGTYNTTL